MAVKTRAELKADIDLVLQNNEEHSITPAQINSLLTDIIDSCFLAEDDYTYPVQVDSLEITSPSNGLQVDGTKVIGAQGNVVATLGETPSTSDIVTAVNTIIARLEAHGIIALNT